MFFSHWVLRLAVPVPHNHWLVLEFIQLFVIPWNAAPQASLSITNSWNLVRLMSIELVMPSNHLILCCPLFLLPSIFSSIRIFFQWVGSSHQVAKVLASFSFSISHWKDWCWHTLICFFSMDLPTLDISYKWNHMIWGLLYLASFT